MWNSLVFEFLNSDFGKLSLMEFFAENFYLGKGKSKIEAERRELYFMGKSGDSETAEILIVVLETFILMMIIR